MRTTTSVNRINRPLITNPWHIISTLRRVSAHAGGIRMRLIRKLWMGTGFRDLAGTTAAENKILFFGRKVPVSLCTAWK